jgi:ADP-ribosylglycohydrolase
MEKLELDKYTGCLLGGAVGDALGAPIEFMAIAETRQRYGQNGAVNYVERADHKGRFTDDTQMTLFTAEGLLRAWHRAMLKGIGGATLTITHHSYLRWLHTQGGQPNKSNIQHGVYDVESGWLVKEKGLYVRRSPGNTCLSALQSGVCGTTEKPINGSKGCGGIMRAAPVGLVFYNNAEQAFKTGCDAAAITHGHPSGYLSAGCLASIIAGIAQRKDLMTAINETVEILSKWKHNQECTRAIHKAIELYQVSEPTPENVEKLGGGWVGEETLAISIFCSLHLQDDFGKGVLASINHSGDSDSTGAVTGNILGLILGKSAIPRDWIDNLELANIVEQVGTDLYIGVKGDSYSPDPEWLEKYPPY